MRLNQILITGTTNQVYRTQVQEELIYYLDKSVQVYFRNRTADQLHNLIAPIFEELNNSGEFDERKLYELYDYKVFFRRVSRESDSEDESTLAITPEQLANLEVEKKLEQAAFLEKKEKEQAAYLEEKERLLRYDSSTYYELYQYVFPEIAYKIIKEGGALHVARDIFQNALIVLLERLKAPDFILTCQARTYLHSVSINIWRNLKRTQAQRAIQVEISNHSNTLQESIYFEEIPYQYEKVAALLEKMGNPCKALLESFYFYQLSWEAIVEKFGYANAASARNQKYKCLERIRKELV